MKDTLLKIVLFPLDLIYLTMDAWIISMRGIKRLLKKEKDQPCHFCQGDDHSESPHPVRSVLKYHNEWMVRLLSPCIRFKRVDGRRMAFCKREGGFTKPPAVVPAVAVGLTFFWVMGVGGVLFGLSSDRDNFWTNPITFFNPRSMETGEEEVDFLERQEAQLNPERAERYYRTGRKALDQRKFPEAEVNFKRAIQSNPTDPKLHYHLARALFGSRQFVDCEGSLRKTLEFDPDHVEALLMLAQLTLQREKQSEAFEFASRALELEPDNLQALRLNVSLRAERGDREEVRELIDKLVELDGDNPATLSFAGRIEFNVFEDVETAKALLTRSLEMDPNHTDALLAMIPIHAGDRDMEKVNGTMERILELEPDNLQALRLRAEMQMSRFGVGVGLRYYGDLMNRFGNNRELRLRYAELLLQSGNITEGKRLANELTASRVPNIERSAHWMLARMYARLRMYDEAIKHAQDTLRLAPGSLNVQVFLAQQYLQSDEPTLARRALERAMVAQPDNPELVGLMAQILVRSDRREEALALLEEKLEKNPDEDRLRIRKVEILMESPQWMEAFSDTELLLEKYPNEAALRNNMAFLLARSGQDLERALSLMEPLKEQAGDNAVILDTYAYVLAAMGRHEEALEIYEEALSRDGGNMTIRFHYAKSLAAVGRNEEALRQLEAVLIVSPDFPQADEARALQNQLEGGV